MKNIFEKLYSDESLNYEEARTALIEISSGDQNEIIISSFLTSFILRPPTCSPSIITNGNPRTAGNSARNFSVFSGESIVIYSDSSSARLKSSFN